MLGGADNPNGELLSYIIGADKWSSIRFYGVWRNRSAAQNRWKNHGM